MEILKEIFIEILIFLVVFDFCEQKFVDTNKFTRNQKELPNDSQSNNSSQSNSKSNKSNYLLNITHNSCKPDALYYDCFNTLVLVGEEKRESLISAKNDIFNLSIYI